MRLTKTEKWEYIQATAVRRTIQNSDISDCGSIMEELLENEGLYFIVKNISSFLDAKSLAQCRLVCQSYRNLIDNDRQNSLGRKVFQNCTGGLTKMRVLRNGE